MSLTTSTESEIVELKRQLADMQKSLQDAVQQNQVLAAGVNAGSAPSAVADAAVHASKTLLAEIDGKIAEAKAEMNRHGPSNAVMARLWNLQKERKAEETRLAAFSPAKPVPAAKLISADERRQLDELQADEQKAAADIRASGGRDGMAVVRFKRANDARRRLERQFYGRSEAPAAS